MWRVAYASSYLILGVAEGLGNFLSTVLVSGQTGGTVLVDAVCTFPFPRPSQLQAGTKWESNQRKGRSPTGRK